MIRISNALRSLARSTKYQNLYCMAKEIGGIQLFENICDFSKIQLDFMYWVSLYNRLYTDLAMAENKYISKKIIETDNWLDYYLIWERKKDKRKPLKDDDNKKVIDENSSVPGVRFV